ncbi:MAG: CRISPR system precrRNA processing endoribonuclease RAMP protein Cas6 [Cyanobacteria bacterium J06581_3]
MSLLLEKSDHLHAITLKLVATESGQLPKNLNRAAHAQVLTWISAANRELGDLLHNMQGAPISVSDLLGNHRPQRVKAGDEFLLRIGILQGTLLQPLLQGIEKCERDKVEIAQLSFAITGIFAMPGSHPWVGSSQYSMLFTTAGSQSEIILDFRSPTSFKQDQIVQPFPLPASVFGSLLRRWNTFAPEAFELPKIEWQGLVAAFEIKSKIIQMKGGAQKGAVGWVRYQFPNEEQSKIANTLAHFAYFSGVGRKTAQGMGQTYLRLPGTKPKPRKR